MVDNRDPELIHLTTRVCANTITRHRENSLERHAMPAYARSLIVPPDEVGVLSLHRAVRTQGVSLRCRSPHQTRLRSSQGMDSRTTRAASACFRDRYLRRRSNSTSTCRCSTGPVDSFVRRVERRSRPTLRRFWSDWESSVTVGSRRSGNSAVGSRRPSADPMRWRPSLHAGAKPGSKVAAPLPWPFDSRPGRSIIE